MGGDVEKGERSVWVVEGGKYKASFLLGGEGERLLISEVSFTLFEWGGGRLTCVGGRLLCRGLSMMIMIF